MKYVSYSKITSFISCPLKYNFQYVEKLEGDPASSSSAQLGKYIHEVLEHYREGLDINEVAKLFENKYTIADEEKAVIPRLLENARDHYQPYAGKQFESELRLEHKINEDYTINGIIDKLYHLDDGAFAVIDFKTGRTKTDNSLQMKFYIYLLWKNRGVHPSKATCKIYYLRTKQTVTYEFDEATITEFEGWLSTMCELTEKVEKFNHNFSSACNYCAYKNTNCQPYKIKKEKYGLT